MARSHTPDTLIGLGEGGSRIVYRFMQQDWILDEVLRNEKTASGAERPDELHATIIDSATGDQFHADKASATRTAVKNAIDRSAHEPEDQYLTFHGPHVIPDMLTNEWKGGNLTSKQAIPNMARDVGLRSWWLEEGREPLSRVSGGNFDGGVFRRRAVSKALFNIADHLDVGENGLFSKRNVRGDNVMLVAALGGGTGSGMVIDAARRIADMDGNQNIHLFGVLPKEGAKAREKVAGHAALSELEYIALAGDENPFDTINLMPHLDAITDNNEGFEKAAVRAIIGHANGVQSENNFEALYPNDDDTSTAPGYAPFVFMVPQTVQFDLQSIETAKDVVDDELEAKRDELQAESQLYSVVEEYLKQSFSNSAGEVLRGNQEGTLEFDDGEGLDEAIRLEQRFKEKLLGTFLENIELRTAGLEEWVEKIKDAPQLSDESMGITDEMASYERAPLYVANAPRRMANSLSDGEFGELTDADGRPYKLVDAVRMEAENIDTRLRLYRAISQISANELDGIDETEAQMLRRGLLDVTLDSSTGFLMNAINDPSVDSKITQLREERGRLEDSRTRLEEFHEEVVGDLRSRHDEFFDEAGKAMETLGQINSHEARINAAIDDLADYIDGRLDPIKEEKNQPENIEEYTLNLSAAGPLGNEELGEINGVAQIDDPLEKMGVDQLPADEISTAFDAVVQAKVHKLNHGPGGIFGGGQNNTEEFGTAADGAEETGWFTINPNRETDIENKFEVEFNDEHLSRADEITQNREEAIETILDAFETAFTENGALPQFEFPSDEVQVVVPTGRTIGELKSSIKTALNGSDAESSESLLDDLFPINAITAESVEPAFEELNTDNTSSTANTIFNAYLRPIRLELVEVDDRLATINGTRAAESVGLLETFQQLKGVAQGTSEVAEHITIPSASDQPIHEDDTYGTDLVEKYDGIYELESDVDDVEDTSSNPYLTVEPTPDEILASDPSTIADTNLSDGEYVENLFRRFILNLVQNVDGIAPINSLNMSGHGDHEALNGTGYRELRIRQAYLSPSYETQTNIGHMYNRVEEELGDHISQINASDVFDADRYGYGFDDEVSMVTFIGGVFLDNISLVTDQEMYLEEYMSSKSTHEFHGSYHTVGMGRERTWQRLNSWLESAAADHDYERGYGGYVFRDEVSDPTDKDFIEDIMVAHNTPDETAKDIFRDMMAVETYKSAIDMGVDEE